MPATYLEISDLDEENESIKPTRLIAIASLEIVLKSGATTGIALRLNAYPPNTGMEGYWAPPCLLYVANEEGESDIPVGTTAIREAFEEFEASKVGQRIPDDIRRLAESFGIRSPMIERITGEAGLIEIKPSINQPGVINAYHTMRYRFVRAKTPSTYINLIDPEGRHGFVIAPLRKPDEDTLLKIGDDPNGTGKPCRFFLGKPIMSGMNRLLERPQTKRKMIARAIDVSSIDTYRESSGLVVAADVAGYGAALALKLQTLASTPESERAKYRQTILASLEETLASLGTTHLQSAGDGFIAGYPSSTNEQVQENLERLITSWTRCVVKIETEINTLISTMIEVVGDTEFTGLGSRMAVTFGDYSWGKINGISSFYSAFDGDSVVRAARLEQGINQAVREKAVRLDTGAWIPLNRRAHYLAMPAAIGDFDLYLANGWTFLGKCELHSKETTIPDAYIYEWVSPKAH